MRGLTFDELFAMLLAVQLSPDDLSRLREWIAGIADPAECTALIEQAAAGRPCPHCRCARKHRCGQASGLQRFRCLGVYQHFAEQAGITHEAVNVKAGVRARGAIHVQNVNSWHSRFKSWLVRFRGVASRYLIHYSGWQRVLDDRRLTKPAHLLCAAVQLG